VPKSAQKPLGPTVRNPARTRELLLAAALQEFAARGFAGARVDAIARRAAINKRMLYHYFGDKEALFREVLRSKIAERQTWAENLSGDPADTLPFWFQAACRDKDWIRLLAWEALQGDDGKIVDEARRRKHVELRLSRLRSRQKRGFVSPEMDPRHVMLAMISLTMFPMAFPQLTRLIMGRFVHDPRFQSERVAFLQKFADGFKDPKLRSSARLPKSRRTK
jgi:AcrR family transcriptional regulator